MRTYSLFWLQSIVAATLVFFAFSLPAESDFEKTKRAAEQGDAKAQNHLGYLYATGEGVQQGAVKAVRWFRMAAEQGYTTAKFNLGFAYDSRAVLFFFLHQQV